MENIIIVEVTELMKMIKKNVIVKKDICLMIVLYHKMKLINLYNYKKIFMTSLNC